MIPPLTLQDLKRPQDAAAVMPPTASTLAPITPAASPEQGAGSAGEIRHPPTRYNFPLMAAIAPP